MASKSRSRGRATGARAKGRKADLRVSEKDRTAGHGRRSRRSGSARRSQKRRRGPIARFVRGTLVVCLVGFVAVAGVLGYFATQLPETVSWSVPDRPPNIKILANQGELIANRGDTGGEAVRLDELPPYVANAVIAIEDRRFRHHLGIDPIGLTRAIVANARAGAIVQGGSTITQQLAKNLFLTPERTLERKIQEVVLALWLEARYSKDHILELYLNRVYLGAGAYGVDAAARRYFNKPARELTLPEAALIAGLLKAPSRYSPISNPEGAEARTQPVLAAMRREGFIDDREAGLALSSGVKTASAVAGGSGSYVADWIVDVLPDYVSSVDSDLIVDTTIDMQLQASAAKAVADGLDTIGQELGVKQGALVAIDGTGAVRALVGGRDYARSQFNRAVDARRQPGSAFKPFVYLTALEYGLRPETVRIDQPVSIGSWSPENYGREYRGPVTLRTALALSINTVAVQLAHEVGPAAVVETAERLGITSKLGANPSIALGTSEVSLLELTGAYAPFANGGYGVIPHAIKRISTEDGQVLFERRGSGPGRVIDPTFLGMMNLMLQTALEQGTGRKAAIAGWPAAGKTGTSQEFRDAWFVGYTANLTTGVWFGNDDGTPAKHNTGGNLPATVWNTFMTEAHEGVPVAALPGNYQFRDPNRFAGNQPPPQTVQQPYGQGVPGDPRYANGYPVPGPYPGQGYPTASADPNWQGGPVPPGEIGGQYRPGPLGAVGGFFQRLFGG